jgi:probable rRNA maturation factor
MKLKIDYRNEQRKVRLPVGIYKQIIQAVGETLKDEKFPYSAEISVTFIDNKKIHKLNLQHREKDRPTDVLSFPMWEKEELADGSAFEGHAVMLGDIIISAEKAKEQALEYGQSLERELAFLAVHSTLHLLGYDHEVSEEDDRYMNDKQEEVLTRIGLTRG